MAAASATSTIPLQVLKEAIGHVVAVELASKEEYRGNLIAVEDSMNVTLQTVAHTGKDGKKSSLEEVYLRGSAIRLFVLPTALSNAPVLKLVGAAVPVKKEKKATGTAGQPAAKKRRVA